MVPGHLLDLGQTYEGTQHEGRAFCLDARIDDPAHQPVIPRFGTHLHLVPPLGPQELVQHAEHPVGEKSCSELIPNLALTIQQDTELPRKQLKPLALKTRAGSDPYEIQFQTWGEGNFGPGETKPAGMRSASASSSGAAALAHIMRKTSNRRPAARPEKENGLVRNRRRYRNAAVRERAPGSPLVTHLEPEVVPWE